MRNAECGTIINGDGQDEQDKNFGFNQKTIFDFILYILFIPVKQKMIYCFFDSGLAGIGV